MCSSAYKLLSTKQTCLLGNSELKWAGVYFVYGVNNNKTGAEVFLPKLNILWMTKEKTLHVFITLAAK